MALVRALERAADRPLMFNTPDSPEAEGFLQAAGYSPVVTSTSCRVAIDAALSQLNDSNVEIAPGVTIEAFDTITATAADLYEDIYRARHRWAGRYTPPEHEPWIGFAGPLIPMSEALQVALTRGTPIAAASLHTGPLADGADAFLAPTSVTTGDLKSRKAILSQLLRRLLTVALKSDLKTVNVEYDTPYDDLAAIIDPWPTTNHRVRQIWQRRAARPDREN